MASASRLSLRAGVPLPVGAMGRVNAAAIATGSSMRATSLPTTRPFSTSRPRLKTGLTRAALANAIGRAPPSASPRMEMARRIQESTFELTADALSIVLPGTFVLPPLSQFPKPLGQKLKLLGFWLLIKGQETIMNFLLKFASKPSFFKRASYKPKRSVLIPTAKALHRSMAEALAAGDKDSINRICSRQLGSSLLASIDARPRSRRYGWELVDYTNKLFYPSLKSHRISPLGRERNSPIVRQAVVAISSRQRRVQYDANGQIVPGSEKEMDVVENVAIACVVDPKTWVQSEWRLIGTVKPTTLEAWDEEKKMLQTLMNS